MMIDRRCVLKLGATTALASTLPTAAFAAEPPPRMRGVIDVHSHAMLPSWRQWMAARFAPGAPRIEGRDVPEWSPAAAIEAMDAYGVQAMMLSSPVGSDDMVGRGAPALARKINEELAAVVARHPRRFGGLASLPLEDVGASLAEIRHAFDTLGLDGVSIPTSSNGAYPGDPRLEPVLAELNRRKATVLAHPRSPIYIDQVALKVPPGMLEFVFDSTRAVVSLVSSGMRRKYPDFNYIVSHAGGTVPFLADRIGFATVRAEYPERPTYDEVLAGLRSFHYDLALTTYRPAMRALRELVPVSQILTGFDYPFAPRERIGAGMGALAASGVFTQAELTTIATENPQKLFPALARRIAAAA